MYLLSVRCSDVCFGSKSYVSCILTVALVMLIGARGKSPVLVSVASKGWVVAKRFFQNVKFIQDFAVPTPDGSQ